MGHSSASFYRSIKIIDLIFNFCEINIPKVNVLIFVAYFLAVKVDQKDSKIPYIDDVLVKMNFDCSKEEFLYFERMVFWKVLRGNAMIKTPYDQLGEIIAHLETSGEDVKLLKDVSLVILDRVSQNFYAFNQDPTKVASAIVLYARDFLSFS